MSEFQNEANYQYGFERGKESERKRIIKLLEDERTWLMTTNDEDNERDAEGIFYALEMIKGEDSDGTL